MMRTTVLNAIACLVFALSSSGLGEAQEPPVTAQATATTSLLATTSNDVFSFNGNDKSMDVLIDGELFTTFDYGSYAKPILYPILGPGQIGMTRNWPMKDGVAGEAHDDPHHKSMWIAHEISGVDFWAEKGGSVKNLSVEQNTNRFKGKNAIRAASSWVRKSDGKTMLTDWTV